MMINNNKINKELEMNHNFEINNHVRITGKGFCFKMNVDGVLGFIEDLNDDNVMVMFNDGKWDWFSVKDTDLKVIGNWGD